MVSCNSFEFKKDKILNHLSELNEIVDEVEEHVEEVSWFDTDDISEMTDLNIDIIVRNLNNKNVRFSGFVEENDSLIIFIQKSNSIVDAEKRIIYDYANKPRNFGHEKIISASYEITQLNDRWYFSTQGFD